MGLEIELNLAGADGLPRMMNAQVLERIASRDFQTELAQFNLEVNILPHRLSGRVLDQLAEELRTGLAYADRKAREVAAGIVMIGILPTLHATRPHLCQPLRRRPLHAAQRPDRGRPRRGLRPRHRGRGASDLHLAPRSPPKPPAPPCSCTSRSRRAVSPTCGTRRRRSPPCRSRSAPTRRSSSAVSCGASPGRRSSSRPPTPARPNCRPRGCGRAPGSASAGSTPRTTSSRRICATSRRCCRSATTRSRCGSSTRAARPTWPNWCCTTARSTAGTGPSTGSPTASPHLRVENRVLPAGPTVTDVIANTAFYYGLVRALAEEPRPVWTRLPFAAAARNFDAACRYGIDADLGLAASRPGRRSRPDPGRTAGTRGTAAAGGRAGWTPGAWSRPTVTTTSASSRSAAGAGSTARPGRPRPTTARRRQGLDRDAALAAMTRRYCELMHTGEPVHTWPVAWPVTGRAAVPEAWEAAAEGA